MLTMNIYEILQNTLG